MKHRSMGLLEAFEPRRLRNVLYAYGIDVINITHYIMIRFFGGDIIFINIKYHIYHICVIWWIFMLETS